MSHSILPQPLYPWVHRGLKAMFSECVWDLPHPAVALTFDDGPHPDYTPPLLETLERCGVQATFFVVGERAERWPEIAAQTGSQGHHIGLHGYQHLSFPLLAPETLQQHLRRAQAAIAAATGAPAERYRDVRPPNGLFLPHTLALLKGWNYRPIMWSVVPEDWTLPPVAEIVNRILAQVYPGALIVLHDGPEGGSQVAQTVAELIPRLQDRGFSFTTLDDSADLTPDP